MNTKRRIPNELKLKDVKINKPEIDFEKTREVHVQGGSISEYREKGCKFL